MARRIQFRLRAIFYVTAVAAVLCLIVPPLFRVAQRHFAAKRPPPRLVLIEIGSDLSHLFEARQEPTNARVPPVVPGPTGETFIMTTIVRVNGKRVDATDDPPKSAPKGKIRLQISTEP
ncbi:MAG TPA: hypothetical protein VG826_14265 [Pirellulales bacterium]|nr:hypothetical protein [Pirellulales bacterium]